MVELDTEKEKEGAKRRDEENAESMFIFFPFLSFTDQAGEPTFADMCKLCGYRHSLAISFKELQSFHPSILSIFDQIRALSSEYILSLPPHVFAYPRAMEDVNEVSRKGKEGGGREGGGKVVGKGALCREREGVRESEGRVWSEGKIWSENHTKSSVNFL